MNEEVSKLIYSVSQLEKLKENPPSTAIGLKRRAESDVSNILQALHSLAYYNANVTFLILNHESLVIVNIDTGPVYTLSNFEIHYPENETSCEDLNNQITLKDLHVNLGKPALPETILDAEDVLLDQLNLKGYAFASINKREVLVDQKEKSVNVILLVETGSLTYFGPITINGEERLSEDYFYKKLGWNEGDIYDPLKVAKTQEALELGGLLKSVNITHSEEPSEDNTLPITISVVEAKQRSIGFGAGYSTELGPGLISEWEDRNIFGNGQKLSFRLEAWQIRQEGILTYVIPDYKRPDQNLIWQLNFHHDKTKGYTDSTVSLSGRIDRKLTDHLRFSYGGMYKHIRSEHSARNGTFDLFQIPLQLRWSNADSILEPTKGGSITIKSTPSLQFLSPQFAYCINTFTSTYYQSLTKDKRHIMAAKIMLGSIFGGSKHDIPPPERFYAGSENALRGYSYLTVSPIGHHHKPLGGRSLFIYSLELRNKIGKNFGWVAFYEIGNVYANPYPDLLQGMLQSVGVGLRYYTPVGPLRLDVAVPLNRRKHIDGPFQFYFSIGQSF
ncbi:MAG: outer membrane protein assembly factor [Parachlamydiaceae bacterium]|nr:outer membrane protein assembly factor [Parachlamydiaceae bacterium]